MKKKKNTTTKLRVSRVSRGRTGTKGYTFGVTNALTQSIINGGELSLFDDEYSRDENENKVINCETGIGTTLSQLEGDILTYLAIQINDKLDAPNIQEFIKTLPRRVRQRQEERRGGPQLVLKTYPTLTNVKILDIVRERYGNTKGGKKRELITRALYSVSRKGYPFVFEKVEGGGKRELLSVLNSRFFHVTNPKFTDKTINVKVERLEKDAKGNELVVRYDKEVKVLDSCDIILEDVFFAFVGGFSKLPTNILTLKREAQVPNNELYEYLYYYIVRQRGKCVNETKRKVKARKTQLQEDETLTDEEREKLLDQYKRECLTIEVGVPHIISKLRGTTYHRLREGKRRNYLGEFDKQLPEAQEALKRIGLVTDYYERKGVDGSRILCFVINSEWLSQQRTRIQYQLPTPQDGEIVDYEEVEE